MSQGTWASLHHTSWASGILRVTGCDLLHCIGNSPVLPEREIAYQSARDDSDAYKSPQPANLWGRRSIPLICGT